MEMNRRAMVLAGIAGGAAAAAVPATGAVTGKGAKVPAKTQIEQVIASRDIENLINRYEVLLAQGYVTRAYDLFSRRPDVQADVGFGLYYGPEAIRTLFIDLHGNLVGDADKGGAKPGAFYCVENTSGIVEVAQDLKTARGLWFGAAYSTPGNPEEGFSGKYGMARRAVDFIYEDGRWMIWHYVVYGMLYAPIGLNYTDPAVYNANAKHDFTFPGKLAPGAPPAKGAGPKYTWRPDTALTPVLPPEPYRTFSETASYALK